MSSRLSPSARLRNYNSLPRKKERERGATYILNRDDDASYQSINQSNRSAYLSIYQIIATTISFVVCNYKLLRSLASSLVDSTKWNTHVYSFT